MKHTPQKTEFVTNGVTLWSQSGGRMVFARQLEPTAALYSDDMPSGAKELLTPILVGYDGEQGRYLDSILLENDHLKDKVEDLELQAASHLSGRINALENRLNRFSLSPWYKRIVGGL